MSEQRIKLGGVCYERVDGNDKRYVNIGELFLIADEECNKAVLDITIIPTLALAHSPNIYLICSFRESSILKEAIYLSGDILSEIGEKVGHIQTRQTADGESTQYYMQLFGFPTYSIGKNNKDEFLKKAEEIICKNHRRLTPSGLVKLLSSSITFRNKITLTINIV